MLEDMLKKSYKITWLETVLAARRKFDITLSSLNRTDWASHIRKSWGRLGRTILERIN